MTTDQQQRRTLIDTLRYRPAKVAAIKPLVDRGSYDGVDVIDLAVVPLHEGLLAGDAPKLPEAFVDQDWDGLS